MKNSQNYSLYLFPSISFRWASLSLQGILLVFGLVDVLLLLATLKNILFQGRLLGVDVLHVLKRYAAYF